MSISLIKKFHGHLGIWICIGYKAGKYAKQKLKPKSFNNLTADVYLVYEKPYSCMLDGVQLSSCCTIGKKNLNVHECEDYYTTLVFLDKKTDKYVKLKLTKEIFDEIEIRRKVSKTDEDAEEDAKWILKMPIKKLFEVNNNSS